MIEALWASLDQERPSGDDPARVVSALSRFYTDLQRGYTQGRRYRWHTPTFTAQDGVVRRTLERALEITGELSQGSPKGSPLLEQLRQVDHEMRTAFWALEQEEKTLVPTVNESPKLAQFGYLFEGWAKGYLEVEPLEEFLRDFHKSILTARNEISTTLKSAKNRDRESEEETSAVEQGAQATDEMAHALQSLMAELGRGPVACRPLHDRVMQAGGQMGQSYHRLEKVTPITEPCPFCGGNLSLSGRCRSCGRRLPHLEEVEGGSEPEGPQSDFQSMNLRCVDLALKAFEEDPDNEALWKEFQDRVRHFGKQVDAGKQHVEMMANAPDRPIDSAASERLAETELAEISAVFVTAQRALSSFAFQPFPPHGDLPEGWREPLLAVEPRLQALETKWSPPPEEQTIDS